MKRKLLHLLCCLLLTAQVLLLAACGTEATVPENSEKQQTTAEQLGNAGAIIKQGTDESRNRMGSVPKVMYETDLTEGDYLFVSCDDVTKQLELHKKGKEQSAVTAPVDSERSPIYIDPEDTAQYTVGRKNPRPDTSVVVSPDPGEGEIPLGNRMDLPFWGYGKNTILSQNAEFKNENGEGFTLDIESCVWDAKEASVEVGLCNLETKKCYSYPLVTDCGYVWHRYYDFSEIPAGTYRFFVRNLSEEPLRFGVVRFYVTGSLGG